MGTGKKARQHPLTFRTHLKENVMGPQKATMMKNSRQPSALGAAANVDAFLASAEVPILDDDLLDDGYFEPDGVNDFVRDAEAWDPDREF